ncbi:MAG: hypothetical protein AAF490_16475 [Chloroflexota bacterium]
MMNRNQIIQQELKLAGNRRSFLLRLWRENGRSPWRIMLQATDSSIRQSFADVPSFFDHLEQMMIEESGGDL